jgi:hypothetical protein
VLTTRYVLWRVEASLRKEDDIWKIAFLFRSVSSNNSIKWTWNQISGVRNFNCELNCSYWILFIFTVLSCRTVSATGRRSQNINPHVYVAVFTANLSRVVVWILLSPRNMFTCTGETCNCASSSWTPRHRHTKLDSSLRSHFLVVSTLTFSHLCVPWIRICLLVGLSWKMNEFLPPVHAGISIIFVTLWKIVTQWCVSVLLIPEQQLSVLNPSSTYSFLNLLILEFLRHEKIGTKLNSVMQSFPVVSLQFVPKEPAIWENTSP